MEVVFQEKMECTLNIQGSWLALPIHQIMSKELISKILTGVIASILMAGLGLAYNWFSGISHLPDQMDALEKRIQGAIRTDSVAMVKFLRQQDSALKTHDSFLKQDWDEIQKLKTCTGCQ